MDMGWAQAPPPLVATFKVGGVVYPVVICPCSSWMEKVIKLRGLLRKDESRGRLVEKVSNGAAGGGR